jgi:hypothetical protein
MRGAHGPADHVGASVSSSETFLMPRSYVTEDLPSSPPPEVLDEVFAAWERAQEPLPESLVLHFASEPALGRAWGELKLDDGTFLASISASEALAIACGDAAVVPAPVLAV